MTARSAIWNFFTEKDDNSDKATCNSCGSDYSCKNGTTSSLINHLKSKHKEIHQQFMKTTVSEGQPEMKPGGIAKHVVYSQVRLQV